MVSDTKYNIYIKRVKNGINREIRISSDAIEIMNDIINYSISILMKACNSLKSNKKTLEAREIKTAVNLILPGELEKHAIVEGFKSVTRAKGNKDGSIQEKSELKFPISRISNEMKKLSLYERQGKMASVYMTSVIEYLVVEIIEVSVFTLYKKKRKTITVDDIKNTIKIKDAELVKLYENITLKGKYYKVGNHNK